MWHELPVTLFKCNGKFEQCIKRVTICDLFYVGSGKKHKHARSLKNRDGNNFNNMIFASHARHRWHVTINPTVQTGINTSAITSWNPLLWFFWTWVSKWQNLVNQHCKLLLQYDLYPHCSAAVAGAYHWSFKNLRHYYQNLSADHNTKQTFCRYANAKFLYQHIQLYPGCALE